MKIERQPTSLAPMLLVSIVLSLPATVSGHASVCPKVVCLVKDQISSRCIGDHAVFTEPLTPQAGYANHLDFNKEHCPINRSGEFQ